MEQSSNKEGPKEVTEGWTSYEKNFLPLPATVPQFLEEFIKPCGRFKVPLSQTDLQEVSNAKKIANKTMMIIVSNNGIKPSSLGISLFMLK